MSDPVSHAQGSVAPVDRATLAARWWRALQDRAPNDEPNRLGDRAARARLRRADGPLDAAAEPAVLLLYRSLYGPGWNKTHMVRTLRVALVLVHVRDELRSADGSFAPSLARSLGPTAFGGEDAAMSPLRLRALLAARDEGDIVRRFRRAVALLDGRANVRDLANVLLGWELDSTRTRFAFDYFGAGLASPAAEPLASAL